MRDPPLADVSAKIVRLRPPLRGASVIGASVRYGRRRGLHAPYALLSKRVRADHFRFEPMPLV
ncbi:MAG: hypothetical protein SWC40_04735 [Thermodesulfobacteriota bacterium]|nr:hypothetical protein [Thermodesulfobacteriota bacterium]